MKYEVFTTIQTRIIVSATSETEAMAEAEQEALLVCGRFLETSGKTIAAAREADEVEDAKELQE